MIDKVGPFFGFTNANDNGMKYAYEIAACVTYPYDSKECKNLSITSKLQFLRISSIYDVHSIVDLIVSKTIRALYEVFIVFCFLFRPHFYFSIFLNRNRCELSFVKNLINN